MDGQELGRERARLGASLEEVGRRAGLDLETLGQWEQFGLKLPKDDAAAVRAALWTLRYERVMEASGLPECAWMEEHASGEEPPDPELVQAHVRECETCLARDRYARAHVPRMPGAAGWLNLIMRPVLDAPAPVRSMLLGFLFTLVFTGIPIVFLLGGGILRGEAAGIAEAGALLAVTAAGGGAGGLVHYLTGWLRGSGATGHYLSWIFVLWGYAAGVMGCLVGLEALAPELMGGDGDGILAMIRDPVGIAIFLVLGAIFGIALGRGARESDHGAVPAPPKEPGRLARGSRTAAKVALPVLALLLVGLRWWSDRVDQERIGGPLPTVAEARTRLPALESAVRSRPDDAAALYDLAAALVALGRTEEALAPMEKAAALVPRNATLQNAYGWCLMQVGRFEDALEPLRLAAEREPEWAEPRANLGYALARLDRRSEAMAAFEEAEALGGEEAWARGMLARLYVEERRFDRGMEEAEAAARAEPSDPFHRETEARALLGLGRMDEALEQYREAARLAPDEAWYWRELGRMAHMLARYDEADRAFSRVQQLQPDFFDGNTEDRALRDEAHRLRATTASSGPAH